MTRDELYAKYTTYRMYRKSMGKGRKDRITYKKVWIDATAPARFLKELKSIDREAYGIELCRIEYADMTLDRWWDIPNYRKQAIKTYRAKIADIRKEYGLSYEAVRKFYDVA